MNIWWCDDYGRGDDNDHAADHDTYIWHGRGECWCEWLSRAVVHHIAGITHAPLGPGDNGDSYKHTDDISMAMTIMGMIMPLVIAPWEM